MGLLERVQKKAGEGAALRHDGGRLDAGEVKPQPEAPSLAVVAPPTPTPGPPPLAPLAPDGSRTSGATASTRAAAALVKPTSAQTAFTRIKSRVHARLVEE